ncbi:MAG: MmgE/PrpD family protein, partial [Alphaproteobacteria bacterium]
MALTADLAELAIGTPSSALVGVPQDIVLNSILDWIAVGRAGSGEPVSRMIRHHVRDEGGVPEASVFGGAMAPARAAALANGATSHALDYDDTHFHHVGHLSVVVIPAALAMAEARHATGRALLDSLVVGFEVACRVGGWLGRPHYDAGFHQTATAGCFGATAAACRLLGLDTRQTCHALGLASTRAAGLRSQFGTMGKPLNAGFAASNAVECAGLAARGILSTPEGLEGPQGFGATHAGSGTTRQPDDTLLMRGNSYKFHACCHGTHAALEALETALRQVPARQIASVTLGTHPRWIPVCNIERP